MAVRDRNMFVWQAYVIASSIISLLLLVGMFFLWRAWNDTSIKLQEANTKNQTVGEAAAKTNDRFNRVMSMVGITKFGESDLQAQAELFKADPELGPLELEFAKMQTLFPANTSLADRNLLKLPQLLLETIRLKNQQLADARTKTTSLQAQMTKEVDDHRRARQTAEDAQKKAETDLADVRTASGEQIKKLNQEKEQVLAQFNAFQTALNKDLEKQKSEAVKWKSEALEKGETIAKQTERIQQFENPDYAAPQGRITNTGDGGTMVWINIGKANGLRRGVPFTILDQNEVEIAKAVPKARMIVQELSEDGSSARGEVFFGNDVESRNRYYKNPIKTGDMIYSPVWRPGRKVSFALVGKMDINDDFTDDLAQVKQLIISAGGVIDAELPAKAAESGKITAYTNYLVIGTDVLSAAESPVSAEKAKDYAKFMAKAESNGTIKITIDKLIGLLKIDESNRTIPLGPKAQGSDFKIRNQVSPQSSSGGVSEIFNLKP
jgi:hypothetical protein